MRLLRLRLWLRQRQRLRLWPNRGTSDANVGQLWTNCQKILQDFASNDDVIGTGAEPSRAKARRGEPNRTEWIVPNVYLACGCDPVIRRFPSFAHLLAVSLTLMLTVRKRQGGCLYWSSVVLRSSGSDSNNLLAPTWLPATKKKNKIKKKKKKKTMTEQFRL